MTNNDILRRIRYLLNYNDLKMVELFKLADYEVEKTEVSLWLKPEEDSLLKEMKDIELAIFLNGLIIKKRGKREGPQPAPEEFLSNNMVLRKLKIAFNLKSDDILDLFSLVDKKIGKHELSAFFRHPDNKSYEPCGNQYLRHFLSGLQAKYKDTSGRQATDTEDA